MGEEMNVRITYSCTLMVRMWFAGHYWFLAKGRNLCNHTGECVRPFVILSSVTGVLEVGGGQG